MQKILNGLEVAPENHKLFATINFAFFMNGIAAIMIGVILPYIRAENNLSFTQSGLLLSAHQIGNLSAVLIAGILPFIIGRKKSTLLMSAGIIIGFTLAVWVRSPWMLVVALAFTGIGRGTLSNICNVLIADISGNKATGLNILHSLFATGALISPVIVFAYVSLVGSPGWKLAAMTVVLLALIVWGLIARSKIPDAPAKKEKGGSFSFLKEIHFWIPTMVLFFYLAVEASTIGWFVLYFLEDGLLPAGVAGFVPTLHWMMIMAGRVSTAFISKRVENKNMLLLSMAVMCLICFTGMFLSGSAVLCVLFLLGIGLAMAGVYPTTMATMSGVTSQVSVGVTIAIASLGSIFMPGIIGAFADAHGLTNGIALLFAALAGLVGLVVLKMITERQKLKNNL